MKNYPGPSFDLHNPLDPNPWLALSLDTQTPLRPNVKEAWLRDSSSKSRQYFLPIARPIARSFIIIHQILKILIPFQWKAPLFLHRLIVWGLKWFVTPDANYLILRHFNIGSEILEFIEKNIEGVSVPLSPLKPRCLNDLKDNVFLKHDINLYNFIINLNQQLRENKIDITTKGIENLDFSMISEEDFDFKDIPNRWLNFIDLETAIEIYTPVFQFWLTDRDFWRSVNSLQLDETIALYVAKLVGSYEQLVLLNNKHPMVPLNTLRAGYRLVLHGMSSEMLHYLLVMMKRQKAAHATNN